MRARSVALWASLVSVSVLAAACSSPKTVTTTTVPPGTAVLGARLSVWVRAHPATQVGGVSGYGTSVNGGNGSVPQYTAVVTRDGRVVSMRINFPAGTLLADAESDVRSNLPTDARQAASWRGSFAGDRSTYCEFVNFQSAELAVSLGVSPPTAMAANIGTTFYDQIGSKHASSIVKVNTALVSSTANSLGKSC